MTLTLEVPSVLPVEVVVDVENLSIAYRNARGDAVPAVIGASLTLRRGVRYGLVGESGSGKSTIARALVGLMRPPAVMTADRMDVSGVGSVLDSSAEALRAMRGRKVAYVPQNPFGALHPVYSIGEQFHFFLQSHRATASWRESHATARAALLAVGIPDPDRVLLGSAGALSGGMAQRVVIALSTLLGPRLIVADEPTTALDVTVQKQVLDLLAPAHTDDRHTLLLTTHDLGVVSAYCDEVIVMYRGRIVESGDMHRVFTDPKHEYTQHLLAAAAPRRRRVTKEAQR
jgi:ABC-type dipeptide/oligopeptide/nickel transport system ATPase component